MTEKKSIRKDKSDNGYNEGNPFLESLPGMMKRDDFMAAMRGAPYFPADINRRSPEERRTLLTKLDSWYEPLDYMYVLYDMLYRAVVSTYRTNTIRDSAVRINSVCRNVLNDGKNGKGRNAGSDDDDSVYFSTQAFSGAVLGVPGIGKTSAVKRCLHLIPQVIEHKEYQGKPFYTKQINYLTVECPSDCSVKTLALNIISAVDRAIGSDYLTQTCTRTASSALSAKLKIICLSCHVGLIVIDEIQNAVHSADKTRQTRALLKFLVELTNDTSTAVVFIGTFGAEDFFLRQEDLKRRTRGLRLLPLKYDITYMKFISRLWENQLTRKKADLTEKLSKQIYDLSGGIPAYIVKIFEESQAQAVLMGTEKITYETIKRAVSFLEIEVPKTYGGRGTSISDFTVSEESLYDGGRTRDIKGGAKNSPSPDLSFLKYEKETDAENTVPVKRFYAAKRGRPRKEHEENDILNIWEEKKDISLLIGTLDGFGMIERRCF